MPTKITFDQYVELGYIDSYFVDNGNTHVVLTIDGIQTVGKGLIGNNQHKAVIYLIDGGQVTLSLSEISFVHLTLDQKLAVEKIARALR